MNPISPLHQAARAGDLTELRRLLDQGAELEGYEKETGHTPLMAACLSPDSGVDGVEFLLERGANVHARLRQEPHPVFAVIQGMDPEIRREINADMDQRLDEMGMSAEVRAIIDQSRKMAGDASATPAELFPLISLAVEKSSCEKIQLLIDRGADLHCHLPHGHSLLTIAASSGREEVVDLLLAAGAPLSGPSDIRESGLRDLSRDGPFTALGKLLDHGADLSSLVWTPLMRAIALGSLLEVETLLEEGSDLEAIDFWKRTPFLLSLQTGDTAKSALLLARGANRHATGHCAKPPLLYAIERADLLMLDWLIGEGFDLAQTDEFHTTPLQAAIESNAVECLHRLLAAGADWTRLDPYNNPLIKNASHPEIIQTLISLGANPGDLDVEALRSWIGLPAIDELAVSKAEFLANRTRRFGRSNPETMDLPFWRAMVRSGWNGYQAASHFKTESLGEPPVWCYQRFGMSLTALPDGRFVQVAGEHEDHYDPDFCIYNDVILHDGRGGFEILGYPEDVFPPTDFHSATLVGEWIYIIGNLGYREDRVDDETPVYRLRLDRWEIEKVITRGESPGRIHSHHAALENGRIRISGGKLLTLDEAGKHSTGENTEIRWLDPTTAEWSATG